MRQILDAYNNADEDMSDEDSDDEEVCHIRNIQLTPNQQLTNSTTQKPTATKTEFCIGGRGRRKS